MCEDALPLKPLTSSQKNLTSGTPEARIGNHESASSDADPILGALTRRQCCAMSLVRPFGSRCSLHEAFEATTSLLQVMFDHGVFFEDSSSLSV